MDFLLCGITIDLNFVICYYLSSTFWVRQASWILCAGVDPRSSLAFLVKGLNGLVLLVGLDTPQSGKTTWCLEQKNAKSRLGASMPARPFYSPCSCASFSPPFPLYPTKHNCLFPQDLRPQLAGLLFLFSVFES